MDWEKIVEQLVSIAVEYGPKLVGAILVLIVGLFVV